MPGSYSSGQTIDDDASDYDDEASEYYDDEGNLISRRHKYSGKDDDESEYDDEGNLITSSSQRQSNGHVENGTSTLSYRHKYSGNDDDESEYDDEGNAITRSSFDQEGRVVIKMKTPEISSQGSKKQKNMRSKSIFAGTSEHQDLSWRNLNMTLKNKKGDVQKNILNNVWGEAKCGETTAIMGASGAGKTSLFNILAGRAKSRGRIDVNGDIRLGGASIIPSELEIRRHFAFVAQFDSLHEPSTPREALRFSAKLRLPKTTPDEEIDELVTRCIEELGLSSCCDTVIGGTFNKGISGGEMRRTSIGTELVAQPDIIFLDEPTSGLDSYAASQVMKLLDKVANAGNTVLFTIHQPASNVFASFDRLILLDQGRVMYQGPRVDAPEYFAMCNYPMPTGYNPADWVLEVAQTNDIEELEKKGFFPHDTRPLETETKELTLPSRNHTPVTVQFEMLGLREWRNLTRNPGPLIINVSATAFLSVVYALIFFGIGRKDRNSFGVIQSQLGALVNVLISTMMGQSNTALFIFSAERPLFLREYSTDHYSVVPYFISKLVMEAFQSFAAMLTQAVIVYWSIGYQQNFAQFLSVTFVLAMTSTAVSVLLGANFHDPKKAAGLFTLVVVPQFYFSGVFISVSLIPKWIRWVQYLCSLTYASRISMAYEFTDCGDASLACNELLEKNQVDPNDTWWYWLALLGLFVGFRALGIFVLWKKGTY